MSRFTVQGTQQTTRDTEARDSREERLSMPSVDSGLRGNLDPVARIGGELQRALATLGRERTRLAGDDQQVGNLLYSSGMRLAKQLNPDAPSTLIAEAQQLLKNVQAFTFECRSRRAPKLQE